LKIQAGGRAITSSYLWRLVIWPAYWNTLVVQQRCSNAYGAAMVTVEEVN